MFGFLKKKLKDAIGKFSKKAEEAVVEEEVTDAAAIEEAKQEEEALLEEAPEEIPETPEERAQHAKEAAEEPEPVEEEPAEEAPGEPAEEEPATEDKEALEKEEADPVEAPAPEPRREEPEEPITEEPAPEEPVEETLKEEPETDEEEPEETVEEPAQPKKRGFLGMFKKKEAPAEKRTVFTKFKENFTKKTLAPEKFDELFFDLEVTLLENNVAVEVIERIKEDLKQELTTGKVSRLGIADLIRLQLRKSLERILDVEGYDLAEHVQASGKRPYVIAFIGVNGSGKTTTLAKIANKLQQEGLRVVMAASDTFRAAAIDQLKEHADKLNIKLISQGYGADPAAVAYDAVEHAKAKQIDVVMIDTAGRLHSNTNLMAELEKVVRVAKPDLKIFIGESTTGNDCVEQAKEFDRLVGIDAVILSKADVDEKGGAAISASFVTGKPILYLGMGQAYGDLKRFDKHAVLKSLEL